MQIIRQYLHELHALSAEMAPYLLLGFVFAGILHVYIRREKIVRYLGGRTLKSALYAALVGIPLPLCSCGVIPTGIAFHKDGASKPATVSFLISTPQTGVDSILVTWSLLGWPMAVIRPVTALLTGIAGGVAALRIPNHDTTPEIDASRSWVKDTRPAWIRMLHYAFIDFMEDIAKWLVIGLLLAALMAVAIPDGFFTSYLGNPFISMLMVLVASVPLYICATGSVPIAAVLMMKGLSPGAALVFLMAGPATNIATITVIGKTLGKRTLIAYLASIIGGALFFGYLTDLLLPSSYFLSIMSHDHHGQGHHLIPEWISQVSLVIMVFFILLALARRSGWLRGKAQKQNLISTHIHRISVQGMTCNHCRNNVETVIREIPGVTEVSADIQSGIVTFTVDKPDFEAIRKGIETMGYTYEGEVKPSEE